MSERRASSVYGYTHTTEYLFGPGIDEALAVNSVDGSAFFLVDGLGSVIGKDSDAYTLSDGTAYTPFGVSTGGARKLGYTAREEGDFGLWYYRARYYNPAIGRFISEDPLRTIALFEGFSPSALPVDNPYLYALIRLCQIQTGPDDLE